MTSETWEGRIAGEKGVASLQFLIAMANVVTYYLCRSDKVRN